MGNVLCEHVPGQVPERLQRALNRIQNTQTAVMVGEALPSNTPPETKVSQSFVSTDEHHVFVNESSISPHVQNAIDELEKPVLPAMDSDTVGENNNG